MVSKEKLDEIEKRRKEWEEGTLQASLKRFGVPESPSRFYSPLDIPGFDFLEKVGFPGEYPFTAGIYPSPAPSAGPSRGGHIASGGGLVRAGRYSGYGTAEDTRDYYKLMISKGQRIGPNIAFDLPTQCGYDSDNPIARGEVGKVGVAIDTLKDFEVIYEAFTGEMDLDRIASNWTINAPASIIIAMYIALADKRGIPRDKLRGTPQNDILKEFEARGTYIYPPKPSMRLIRDIIIYCTDNVPLMNTISIPGVHLREAGATREQTLAFILSNGIAYVQLGIDAGLDVDKFVHRFSFAGLGGSMEMLKEVALNRASRRMWAKIMRDRFKAKNPRSWLFRSIVSIAQGSAATYTTQRPLNNLVRSVVGGFCTALCSDQVMIEPPYDETLELGPSLEAQQLLLDAARILQYEAKLTEVTDPFAGSYYVESLTDQTEEDTWKIINTIDAMGGAVAAIENGYIQSEMAKSAYQSQRELDTGERIVVGLNAFLGEDELEVIPPRMVPHPYDPVKRAEAEERQLANLAKVKNERDNQQVARCLSRLKEAAQDEGANHLPALIEAVNSYATVGEMCNVFREVFGEHRAYGSI
jgi:methylmalonyl-CoA mutase N-terminal domain/subunit